VEGSGRGNHSVRIQRLGKTKKIRVSVTGVLPSKEQEICLIQNGSNNHSTMAPHGLFNDAVPTARIIDFE
jgi:hypothetical protein